MSKKFSTLGDLFSEEEKKSLGTSKKIAVTFAEYKVTAQIVPDDLFQGFNELHVVTYSLGIKQVEHFMKYFERGEVIIGSHLQISTNLAELLALQKYAVDYVSQNKFLQKMISEQKFKFYVTDKVHAKIYLMKATEGHCRVILASANFSANAWQMRQKENFVVMDEPEAYEHYFSVYEDLRKNAADEIDIDVRPLKADGTNLDTMPAFREIVNVKKAFAVVHVLPPESDVETKSLLAFQEDVKNFNETIKESGIHANKDGKTLVSAEKIITMRKIMRTSYEKMQANQNERRAVAPEFTINLEERTAKLNDELWDLNPPSYEIISDLKSLVEYIDGAEIFTGDAAKLKTLYWKIILYMFVSPFFAKLRYFYNRLVPANSTGKVFPMYMILRGGKNGGKSSIVMTGQKLMFDRLLPTISAKDTAPSKIESFKLTVKGCPIMIDDVTNRNLQYMKEFVKDDSSLISGKILDHGTFIFTSNDAEQVKQEISKRVVVFTVQSQLNEDEAARRDVTLKKLRDKMHNALYRAFLNKIFPAVEELNDEIINGGREDWLPDIFEIASETLIKIFQAHNLVVPSELKIFHWEDYLGEEVKSKQAVGTLEHLYTFYPKIFKLDSERDHLILDLSTLDQKTRQKVSDVLESELPPSTERICIGNIVTMRLSEIKKFARLSFADDKNFLQKVFSLFNRN